jgi:hypothetical protein
VKVLRVQLVLLVALLLPVAAAAVVVVALPRVLWVVMQLQQFKVLQLLSSGRQLVC